MSRGWQRYVDLVSGVGAVTRDTAEAVVRLLVTQGEVAADRAERMVDELLERSEANRRLVAALVRTEVERAIERLGLVRRTELDALRARVERLEAAGTAQPSARRPTRTPAAQRRAGRSDDAGSRRGPA